MSDIKLSIVTATYNDPTGLERTLTSLLPVQHALEKGSWEHVIVDSSPSKSDVVFKTLVSDWPLVHIVLPPKGVYSALNAGMQAARGDCVWFLNGGDLLKSSDVLVEALSQFKNNDSLDLLWAGVELTRKSKHLYNVLPRKKVIHALLGSNHICQQAILYKRTSLDKVGMFSTQYNIAADYEHHFRCLLMSFKVGTLAKVLAVFDMTGASSNYIEALIEFRSIQRVFQKKLPLWVNLANDCMWPLEAVRIRIVKYMARSSVGGLLRPLWLSWKRLK